MNLFNHYSIIHCNDLEKINQNLIKCNMTPIWKNSQYIINFIMINYIKYLREHLKSNNCIK